MNRRTGSERFFSQPLPEAPWPVAARNLLTEREHSFYLRLLSVYPDHKILVQVALSQLIDVPEDHPERMAIRNRFSQLVADFVLCRSDLSVVAVIEVDDRSHERADRQGADARKNKALADAGIPFVRIPAGTLPSEEALREIIDADRASVVRTDAGQPAHFLAGADLELAAEWRRVEENSVVRPSESRRAEMSDLKRGVLKIAFAAVVLVGGWFVFTQFLPFVEHSYRVRSCRAFG